MDVRYNTPREIQEILGKRLQALRLDHRLTQSDLAAKMGVSLRALQRLESGKGSALETFLRFLKAIGETGMLSPLLVEPSISPLALLDNAERPRPRRIRYRQGERR